MRKFSQDVLGSIAILKFPEKTLLNKKKKLAKEFLRKNNQIKGVFEKAGKLKGRLRKAEIRFLAGDKNQETTYLENGCKFKFDINETYFSPRLASHRKEVSEELAKKIKNNQKILVMFAGVAPLPITLGKILKKQNKKVKIISNEINRKANKYAKENIKLNHLEYFIEIISGDAKKLPTKLKQKFDIILMPRANLKNTFLKTALKLSKKGTLIYYHGFGERESVIEEIKKDAGGKIGKIKIKKAGEIAPYRFRWLVKFRVK